MRPDVFQNNGARVQEYVDGFAAMGTVVHREEREQKLGTLLGFGAKDFKFNV